MTSSAAEQRTRADHPLIKRHERRAVELRAFLVRAGDEIVDVRVLDLSYDGCRIETYSSLPAGEVVKLSVLGRGAIRAKVRWCKARKAGLSFETEPSPRKQWPRRALRVSVTAEILLRRSTTLGYRVRVFDASPYGCKCEFIERPRINERVWVKFEGLEALETEVCWVEDSSCGLRFANPIHPAVFDMLLHRLTMR
jgi:hypothetical protein